MIKNFSILYSLGIPNPPVEALMATCALALLHKDNESAQFAANELSKYESDSEYGHHAIYLISQFYLSIVNISLLVSINIILIFISFSLIRMRKTKL